MKRIVVLMSAVLLITASSCKRSNEVEPEAPATVSTNPSLIVQDVSPVPIIVAGAKDQAGYTNGTGASARFNQPYGIFVNTDGTLLVTDQKNGAIRKIANSVVSTIVKNTILTGSTSIAATKDGTIGLNDEGTIVLYKNGSFNFIEDDFCVHCSVGGLNKNADATFFWYADNYYDGDSWVSLESIKPDGNAAVGNRPIYNSPDGSLVQASAVSTSLNDNKFIALQHGVYQVTHSGVINNILSPNTFGGLTDIAVNKDGTKLYVADKGDIKLITRCSTCPTKLTVLVAHVDATGLALSNSEKVLFFTSVKHHTVSKINLP